ncbi:Hpt domain-containing protein [Paraburkholderia phytofirmans]|uniref:Hpt domain-containing protein n=1 Tax=Paraburkholderia phytofirmans TaxID=261302 RepID=A0ABW9BT86_9BURK
MVNGNAQPPLFGSAAESSDSLSSGPFEPFEIRYLDALSEEGVNLDVFLNNWRQAMNDDLARLDALPRDGDFDHFHRVLHRLSGAAALVGAHSLMDALRRASLSPPDQGAAKIDALTARARSLVTQLEAASRAFRSRSQ